MPVSGVRLYSQGQGRPMSKRLHVILAAALPLPSRCVLSDTKHDMFKSDHQTQSPLISLLLSSSTKRRHALQPATDTVDVTATRLPFLHVTTSFHVTIAHLSMDAVRDTNTNLAVPPAQFERYAAKPPMSTQDGFHSTTTKKSTNGLMSFGNLTPERTPASQLLIERCDVSFRTIIVCCW